MPFQLRKREEEPSRRLIYHNFLHAGDPLASCGALFIFISPLPLKHPESATASHYVLWKTDSSKYHAEKYTLIVV